MLADEITWISFRVDFLKKHISVHIRDQKFREFQTLVQGNITVYQYKLRFVEVLITPKSERIRRFGEGLRVDIHLHMTSIEPTTYEDAVRRVFWADERLQRVKAMHQ